MAYLGKCDFCVAGEHDKHERRFNSPPPELGFVCGGGICVCKDCEPAMAHLDRS